MRKSARVLVGAALVMASIVLIGCTSQTKRHDPERTPSEAAPAAATQTGVPRITDTPLPSPSPSYVLATPLSFVGGYGVRQPVDHGPETYAEGTVIRDAEGDIVAYRVASGDIYSFISERFGLGDDDYIVVINQIRRGGPNSADGIGNIYAGDIVNLSAFTMTEYGSVNGEVRNDAPPDPMPPQR